MHTPGPWQIGTSCDRTPAVMVPVPPSEGSGFVIAHINRLPRMGSVRGDMDANARLMAAAPELLAVVTKLAEWQSEWDGNGSFFASYFQPLQVEARAAIAKAKGEPTPA